MLAVRRRVDGRTDPATRAAATPFAFVLNRQGQHVEAAALYCENLAATLADEQEHGITLADKANLTTALSDMGEHAEAEALLRGVRATNERLHGRVTHARSRPRRSSGVRSKSRASTPRRWQIFGPRWRRGGAAARPGAGPPRHAAHDAQPRRGTRPAGRARRGGGALPVRAGGGGGAHSGRSTRRR